MNVSLLAAAQASGQPGKTSGSAQDTEDMFLKLLVTQLKNQSPLEPLDPNQFLGQLAQFNTLDQIIRIRELLEQTVPKSKGAAAGTSTEAIQGGH